jgi:hypothetical protein
MTILLVPAAVFFVFWLLGLVIWMMRTVLRTF